MEFDVPTGMQIQKIKIVAMLGNQGQASRAFHLLGFGSPWETFLHQGGADLNQDLRFDNDWYFMHGATGHQTMTYWIVWIDSASIMFYLIFEPTEQAMVQWQLAVWNACYNAAQTQYYAKQQDIAAQIAQLEDQVNNVDTLTLRREESDEIMKGVLRFLLGPHPGKPDFNFMPQDVNAAIKRSIASVWDVEHVPDDQAKAISSWWDSQHGVEFTGNELGLGQADLKTVQQHENVVRFINQAIEWENVVSFLYSYFWDMHESWDFIRQIKHPDANRQAFLRAGSARVVQAFLRAGSARVVLTVRKGWEQAWTQFAEGGFDGASIDPDHPYFSIAKEIAAYDDRNYPGIPPANPGQSAVRSEDAVYTTSVANLSGNMGPNIPVEIAVDSSTGFVVGAQVVIDTRIDTDKSDPSGMQESQTITAINSDGKHITVEQLDNPHDGSKKPFLIMQPDEKGVLIAEWFEYTPTSGTDIAVTSNLKMIS